MTCPHPDYCGVNGCTNSACHPSRTTVAEQWRLAAARSPRTTEEARRHLDALNADGFKRFPAVPAPPRTPWGRLALGLLCLLAPYAAVAAVMAALWVLT